jgi:hypothetical protein
VTLFPGAIFVLLGAPPTEEERNLALLQEPANLVDSPDVAVGTLPADRTGFGDARRVWALPGPGATLRGLGAVLQERLLRRVPGWSTVEAGELARLGAAVYRVGRRIETGTDQPLSRNAAEESWLVGTVFPLPVWQPTGSPLQVDTAALRTAMGAVATLTVATVGEWSAAVAGARPLDQVDPFHLRTPVTGGALVAHAMAEQQRLRAEAGAAATAAAAGALGGTWGARARWNPYAALFPVLELVAHYRLTATALLDPFTNGFYAAFTARELRLLASTSAGYALIRCLWRASAAGRRGDVAALLGTATTNLDLVDDYPPSTGRLEPPVQRGQTEPRLPTVASRLRAPIPLMGFGRVVPFTVAGYQNAYRGVAWAGVVPPVDALAPATGSPVPIDPNFAFPAGAQPQWSRVLAAIASTEGNLDAATSWDSAVVSLGFQQWSMHVKDSGPALLARLKRLHPEAFDAVVRAAEIDAGLDTGAANPRPSQAAGTQIGEILRECNLWRIFPPGAAWLNPPGYTRAQVQTGFGWRRTGATWEINEPSARFATRWAVAARFVPAIWQAQAEMAYAGILRLHASLGGASTAGYSPIWRGWETTIDLSSIANLPGVEAGGTSRLPTLFELFTSEAAVSSLLDHSVNLPGDVPLAIRRALRHAADAQRRDNAITLVNEEFRWRVLVAHQGARQLNTRGGVVDVAKDRVARLVRLYDAAAGMSTTRQFQWPP